jgi:hypothetical protein
MQNRYELAKFWCLALLFIGTGFYLFGQSTGTGTGGSAQNSSQGGGGSSGGAATNVANAWTAQQIFSATTLFNAAETNTSTLTLNGATTANAPIIALGASNVLGAPLTMSTTNYLYGPLAINTNAIGSGQISVFRRAGGRNAVDLDAGSDALDIFLDIGNMGGKFGYLQYTSFNGGTAGLFSSGANLAAGSSGQIQIDFGSAGTALILGTGAAHSFTDNSGTSTYGVNASSTHTINGSTLTAAHLLSVNQGELVFGAAGSTLTNNTAIFTPSISVSNITMFATPTLVTTFSTPVGQTNYVISVNGNAGTMYTKARMTTMTNTFSGPYVHQLIYTNTGNTRLKVAAAFLMPNTATQVSGVALATISSGITNFPGWISTSSGTTGVSTNIVSGDVDPGDLYWFTNMTVGAGAPTFVPDRYVQKLY